MSLVQARLFGNRGSGAVLDPWSYQEPSDNRPSPCRTIPVTAAMREADARRQRELAHSKSDWTLGAEIRGRRPVQP